MSERFGEAALRLAALSTRALGWAPDTFWAATPTDLANALADPDAPGAQWMTRTDLEQMLEQDRNGR